MTAGAELTLMRAGNPVRLGEQVGRGGEGAVYRIEGWEGRVAKCYAEAAGPGRARKLEIMTRAATPALEAVAAWPTDLLHDAQGAVWGFVMPRVQAKTGIHELYSPRSRSDAFPEADFSLLVRVAANVARAVRTVHAEGHVIGDVNHANILVGPDGEVVLIDCDSFQVADGAELFTCDVGVPLFTAPELQGQALRGVVRTENHDRFGLAVLLFHLLFMGRHPFAGRYSGPDEMSIERAIAEYRFAYGRDRAAHGMQRPPGSVALETMGPTVARLFSAAFAPGGAGGGRPDAASWVAALENLEAGLAACGQASWHVYPGFLGVCPWCSLEIKTGAQLFGRRLAGTRFTGVVDLASLLRQVADVPGPGADPPLPSGRTRRAARRLDRGGRRTARSRPAVHAAQAEWDRTLVLWREEASVSVFDAQRRSIESALAELAALPQERLRRLKQLDREHRSRQLARFLARFPIERDSIPGIGPSRTAMLASYAVETAADVTRRRVLQVPGIDRALAGQLVAWRRSYEREFVYHPDAPVDRRDIEEIDRALVARQAELTAVVAQGPELLRVITAEVLAARDTLLPQLEDSWRALTRAQGGHRARSSNAI